MKTYEEAISEIEISYAAKKELEWEGRNYKAVWSDREIERNRLRISEYVGICRSQMRMVSHIYEVPFWQAYRDVRQLCIENGNMYEDDYSPRQKLKRQK